MESVVARWRRIRYTLMPFYKYKCTNCDYEFELFQSIKSRPKKKTTKPCEKCGKSAPIERLISNIGAIIFKGSGFYATDYANKPPKKGKK